MYEVGNRVQIINHSEPVCNGQYGTVVSMQVAYDGYTYYYAVELDDSLTTCSCTSDELMEEWPMKEIFWLLVILACIVYAAVTGDPNDNV